MRGPTDGRHRGAPPGRAAATSTWSATARSERLHLLPDARRRRGRTPRPSRLDAEARRGRGGRRAVGRAPAAATRRGASRSSSGLDDEAMLPGDLLHLQPRRRATTRSRSASTPGCASPTPDERDRDPRRSPSAHVAALDRRRPRRARLRPLAGRARGRASPPTTPGMVPPFKEAVEACFAAGLVKVVFATETLALGINMPARSVVIEKLSKFTGERHEFLTPGEYTQLTGRAGRRGIDDVGYAVVLWSPFVPFDQVAGARVDAARSRSRRRSGRPTTWPPTSCAATRPTRPTTCSTSRSRSTRPTATSCGSRPASSGARAALAGAAGDGRAARYGDIERVPAQLVGRDASAGPTRRQPTQTSSTSLAAIEARATCIVLHGGQARGSGRGAHGRATARRRCPRRASSRRAASLVLVVRAATSTQPPRRVGHDRAADAVRAEPAVLPARGRPPSCDRGSAHGPSAADAWRAESQRATATRRPRIRCATAPSSTTALRAAAQAERVGARGARARATGSAAASSRSPAGSTACSACSRRGATSTAGRSPSRASGSRGSTTSATCWSPRRSAHGLLDDLDPAALAGLVSCFTYEHRSPDAAAGAVVPVDARSRDRWRPIAALASELNADEDEAGLAAHPPARPGVRRPRPRLGGRARPRRRARGRGAVRRRLRPQREAAHRPARARSATSHRCDRRRGRAARRPTRCFRGVVAASSTVATLGER